jgi:hypothetical protein
MQSTHPLPCDGLNTLPGIPAADLAFDNSITPVPTSASDSVFQRMLKGDPLLAPSRQLAVTFQAEESDARGLIYY